MARPPEHVGRPDHDRIADLVGDRARRLRTFRDAALRLPQPEPVEQLLEAVAVLGEVDGVGRGAEDRHVRLFERFGELERRLPAELHDDAVQRAVAALGIDDLEHVLGGERLEVEPVRGVVVGRDRLRIAVDHDGLVADLVQRERGVAAAVVELDALADAVRPAAEDDDLLLVGWRGLAGRGAGERRLVGRIHVGGGRGELGGAGVDALEHRPHAERAAARAHIVGRRPVSLPSGASEKPIALSRRSAARALRQALGLDLGFLVDDAADLRQEPRIDLAGGEDLVVRQAVPHRLRDLEEAVGVGVPSAARMALRFSASSGPMPSIAISSKPVRPVSSERSAFCSALLEGAADRHRFADRFHRGGQRLLGAGKLLEREARDLGDDVVDGRLERRPASRRR